MVIEKHTQESIENLPTSADLLLLNLIKTQAFKKNPKKFFDYIKRKRIRLKESPYNAKKTELPQEKLDYLKKLISTFNSFKDYEWDFYFTLEYTPNNKAYLMFRGIILRFSDLKIKKVDTSKTVLQRELFAIVPISFMGDLITLKKTVVFTTKMAWDKHLAGSSDRFFVHPHVHSIAKDTFFSLSLDLSGNVCQGSGDFSAFMAMAEVIELSEQDMVMYVLNLRDFIFTQSTGTPYVNLTSVVSRKGKTESVDVSKNHVREYRNIADYLIDKLRDNDFDKNHTLDLLSTLDYTFREEEFVSIENNIAFKFFISTMVKEELPSSYKDKVFIYTQGEKTYSLPYYRALKKSLSDYNFSKRDLPRNEYSKYLIFKGKEYHPRFYFEDFKKGEAPAIDGIFMNVTPLDFVLDPSFIPLFKRRLEDFLYRLFRDGMETQQLEMVKRIYEV